MEAFGTVQLPLSRNDYLPRKQGHPSPLTFSITHQEDRLRMIRLFSGTPPPTVRVGIFNTLQELGRVEHWRLPGAALERVTPASTTDHNWHTVLTVAAL